MLTVLTELENGDADLSVQIDILPERDPRTRQTKWDKIHIEMAVGPPDCVIDLRRGPSCRKGTASWSNAVQRRLMYTC
jgi:hypothetical protein